MSDQAEVVLDEDVVRLLVTVLSPEFKVFCLVLLGQRLRKRLAGKARRQHKVVGRSGEQGQLE
ncbi:MAG: hypothetical protein K6T76_08285, partial [Alicyclobacillus mali]|uniref:hypothetical protein n=1 Tax=Alicyclobacillus mali (ex Roth et al. 2021) TaxID=1123961 RepID=UPI0023EFB9C0